MVWWVATAEGAQPNTALRVGDRVLAYDASTGRTAIYPVRAVLVHTDRVVTQLTLAGERITTTPEHPFFTRERGWVAAGELEVGEQLRRAGETHGLVL